MSLSVPDAWVCNASPLILFKRIERLSLLSRLCTSLIIPAGVIQEVKAYAHETRIWDDFSVTVRIVNVPAIAEPVTGWDLGRGESEVITWAYQNPGHEAILDDLAARKCASSLGIPLRGTVGLILLAKKRGLVPAAKPLVDDLIKAGMRFDSKWLRGALALVGE